MKIQIVALLFIIVIISFLGFLVENMWLLVTKGYMDNRNMHLPFLLGYGLAVITILLLFGMPTSPRILKFELTPASDKYSVIVYFGIVFFCVSVGEWMLGTIVEKMCGIVWWNYSRLPMHITKYTSVPTSIGFSIMITTFMNYIFEPLYHSLMTRNHLFFEVVSYVLICALIIDFLYSAIWMFKKRSLLKLWRIDFPKALINKNELSGTALK